MCCLINYLLNNKLFLQADQFINYSKYMIRATLKYIALV